MSELERLAEVFGPRTIEVQCRDTHVGKTRWAVTAGGHTERAPSIEQAAAQHIARLREAIGAPPTTPPSIEDDEVDFQE